MSLKFSVVTVVYNGRDSIKNTMESVLNQTLLPYEYIIIDGASTDDTMSIVEGFRESFRNKGILFKTISESDSGIYDAMNKGIGIATGDFLSFLNSGDWYEKDALENIDNFYNSKPFELTYGGLNYVRPDGSVTIKMSKLDKFPVSSRNWNHPSMFLKTDIYKKYKFDLSFKAYSDFNLYLKLRKDGTKIEVIDKVIANFVADGISTNAKLKNVMKRAKEKYAAYRNNGYSIFYFIESYGWELFKAVYFKIHS